MFVKRLFYFLPSIVDVFGIFAYLSSFLRIDDMDYVSGGSSSLEKIGLALFKF